MRFSKSVDNQDNNRPNHRPCACLGLVQCAYLGLVQCACLGLVQCACLGLVQCAGLGLVNSVESVQCPESA